MIEHLYDPAILTIGEVLVGAGEDGLRATHVFHGLLAGFDGRKRIQIGRIAVVPSEDALIDGFCVMTDGAVELARRPLAGEAGWLLEHLGDLVGLIALIDEADGLVIDEFVEVALLAQDGVDARSAPGWPLMLADQDVRVGAKLGQCVVDVLCPGVGVADLRSTQRKQIMQVVRDQLGHIQRAELRIVHDHLRRRFRIGRIDEDDLNAVDGACFGGLFDGVGGRDETGIAAHPTLAQTGIDLPLRHEAFRGIDVYLAGGHIGFGDNSFDSPEVIEMAMAVDHSQYRLMRPMLVVEIEASLSRLSHRHWIDHNQAGISFDDRHGGDVEAANLIDTIRHLEESAGRVDPGMMPQRWIDRIGRVNRIEEAILAQGIGEGPGFSGLDCGVWQRGDETAMRLLLLNAIVGGQMGCGGVVGFDGRGLGVFGLRVLRKGRRDKRQQKKRNTKHRGLCNVHRISSNGSRAGKAKRPSRISARG